MLAPGRRCFDCSKVYCDVTERWLLTWNQNNHIIYFIYQFRNQYWSSIHSPPLHFMAPTSSLRDSSPWFADFHFGPPTVSLLKFHKSVILVPLWFYVFRTTQNPEPFHFHAVLLTRLAWSKLYNNIQDSQQQFEKKTSVSIKN